jgi:hypothetical protein
MSIPAILSEAKDLAEAGEARGGTDQQCRNLAGSHEILRCAQDDGFVRSTNSR